MTRRGPVQETNTDEGHIIGGVPPLTFGIEVEFVLAFHESLLKPHIKPPGDEVVKDLTHWQRKQLTLADWRYATEELGRFEYMSWAVRGNYPEQDFKYQNKLHSGKNHVFKGVYVRPDLRTYWEEPLYMLKEILAPVTDVNVHETEDKLTTFEKWSVMNDFSVSAYSQKRILSKFQDRIHPNDENNWDSYGLELISPVFDTRSNPFPHIKEVLSTVAGNSESSHGAGSSWFAGHHVHIGFPEDEWTRTVHTGTLQSLAYMLLVYEPIISNFHPHHRRPYSDPNLPTSMDLWPNRFALSTQYDHVVKSRDRMEEFRMRWGDKNTYQPPDLISPEAARTFIWTAGHHIPTLAKRISDHKGFIVNWAKFHRDGQSINENVGFQTLEFRQHSCTLDQDEIHHWIIFILALVRAAYRNAIERDAEHRKHPKRRKPLKPYMSIETWPDADDNKALEDLFDLLELDADEARYWRTRRMVNLENNLTEQRSYELRKQSWQRVEYELDMLKAMGKIVPGEVVNEADSDARGVFADSAEVVAFLDHCIEKIERGELDHDTISPGIKAALDEHVERITSGALVPSVEGRDGEVKDDGNEEITKGDNGNKRLGSGIPWVERARKRQRKGNGEAAGPS